MMLQEPQQSDYDLGFELLGFRVRVHWGFWIAAAVLGWNWSTGLAVFGTAQGFDTPPAPVLLLVWIAAVFVSILVHELGHTLAFRYYGHSSRILLYHFGGLAIPTSFGSWNGARAQRLGSVENLVIAAAGPALQLALAAAVIGLGVMLKVPMTILFFSIEGAPQESITTYAVFDALLYPSVFWAILNLAPILPLDGGRIMQSILEILNVNRPSYSAHVVSIGAAAVIGLYFMSNGRPFAGLMFLMFAGSNWQAMQYGGRGY
ncbi:MAG: site-2 protease family protein [Planctomycetota bacterium]